MKKKDALAKLLDLVKAKRPILAVGLDNPKIPDIHSKKLGINVDGRYWKTVRHLGMGCFDGRTEHGTFDFRAGGAMTHYNFKDGGWLSWTPLGVENEEVLKDLGYDFEEVAQGLQEELEKTQSPFGEVIYSYTVEQAIENGTHVDFGNLEKHGYRIIMTTGLLGELNKYQLIHALIKTLNGLTPKTDMIVFQTEPTEDHKEDEGRTLITKIDGLEKKVHAKNDNGVVTIFLAEEY